MLVLCGHRRLSKQVLSEKSTKVLYPQRLADAVLFPICLFDNSPITTTLPAKRLRPPTQSRRLDRKTPDHSPLPPLHARRRPSYAYCNHHEPSCARCSSMYAPHPMQCRNRRYSFHYDKQPSDSGCQNRREYACFVGDKSPPRACRSDPLHNHLYGKLFSCRRDNAPGCFEQGSYNRIPSAFHGRKCHQ